MELVQVFTRPWVEIAGVEPKETTSTAVSVSVSSMWEGENGHQSFSAATRGWVATFFDAHLDPCSTGSDDQGTQQQTEDWISVLT